MPTAFAHAMNHEPLDETRLRRLRFPVEPLAGESLAGLVARACAHNELGCVRPLLRAAGYPGNGAGSFAVVGASYAPDLAFCLGVDISDVLDRAHLRASPDDGVLMDFFGSAIRFAHRDAETRRIAPAALARSPHHRAIWELRPLAFCPETWELLTNRCLSPACGAPLRWHAANGIGVCETCDTDQRAFETGRVEPALRPELGWLAGLVDPSSKVKKWACGRLPRELQHLNTGIVFELALTLSRLQACASVRTNDLGHTAAVSLSDLHFGTKLVLGWPNSVVTFLGEEQGKQPHPFRTSPALARFRRLLWDRTTLPAVRTLLAAAFPEFATEPTAYPARVRKHRRQSGKLSGREAARALQVSASDLAKLRDGGVLNPEDVGGTSRLHGWYDPAEVRGVGSALHNRMSANRFRSVHGLGLPAVEQLVACGLMQTNDHPAVRCLHSGMQLDARSAHNLITEVRKRTTVVEHGVGWIPLSEFFRAVGGREKPLAPLLAEVLGSTQGVGWIGAARHGPEFTLRDLLVRADAIEALWARGANGGCWFDFKPQDHAGFSFSEHLSDQDAIEHLNCHPREFYTLVKGMLRTAMTADGDRVERQGILDFGTRYVSSSELMVRLGMEGPEVTRALRRQRLTPVLGRSFWNRAEVEAVLACLPVPIGERRRIGRNLGIADAHAGGCDVSNAEWEAIARLIPCCRTKDRCMNDRRLVNSILWKEATRLPWKAMPPRYGDVSTRRRQHRHLLENGGWSRVTRALSQVKLLK